jgi:hypothetical protein
MNTDDVKLSRLLQAHDAPSMDDGGFTDRAVAALPQPRANPLRRPLLLISSAIIATALVLLVGGRDFVAAIPDLIQLLVDKPALSISGQGLGFIPIACVLAGLGFIAVWVDRIWRHR